jgi:hypothetical protein
MGKFCGSFIVCKVKFELLQFSESFTVSSLWKSAHVRSLADGFESNQRSSEMVKRTIKGPQEKKTLYENESSREVSLYAPCARKICFLHARSHFIVETWFEA